MEAAILAVHRLLAPTQRRLPCRDRRFLAEVIEVGIMEAVTVCVSRDRETRTAEATDTR